MRRALGLVVTLVAAVSLTGCGDDAGDSAREPAADSVRPLTVDEAERLAAVRLVNYRRGGTTFEATLPTGDQVLDVSGVVEFREHRAIAGFATDDEAPAYGVLAATFAGVGLLPTDGPVTSDQLDDYAATPTRAWQTHAPDATDPLDQLFLVLFNLGADRADNAQLLRQNGAQWLGETTIEGVDVDMMSSTSEEGRTLVYYVDDDGGLLRVDLTVPGGDTTAVTIGQGEARVPKVPAVS